MFKHGTIAGTLASLLLLALKAQAEDRDIKEPSAEIEIGGASERSLSKGGSSFEPTLAVSSPLSSIGSKSKLALRLYLIGVRWSGTPISY